MIKHKSINYSRDLLDDNNNFKHYDASADKFIEITMIWKVLSLITKFGIIIMQNQLNFSQIS